jgi:phosphoribosyl-ATP pyrophosphohydrolase
MDVTDGTLLDQLYTTIATRRGGDPTASYTARLFAEGRGKIARKLGEEAVETMIAALTESADQVIGESADLLYHLLTLWADCGVTPPQVWAELARRQGISGLDEKNARPT